MTLDWEWQLVNSNGDLWDARSIELAVPIRMWKFSCKRPAMLVGFMRSADTRSLANANTYVHLHHYSLFPDFCLCLLNIDGSSYSRFTRRTYVHIWRRSSHRAFETEDISAAHQSISDTMNTFSYNLMRRRLINYNRQKHQAPFAWKRHNFDTRRIYKIPTAVIRTWSEVYVKL